MKEETKLEITRLSVHLLETVIQDSNLYSDLIFEAARIKNDKNTGFAEVLEHIITSMEKSFNTLE